MLAMQYSIQLPRGYDDALIASRVEERSKLFDDLDGMAHKSFLYSSKDKLYAPFYVWENLQNARDFLTDDLFKGVIKSFNRPRVRSWVVADQAKGKLQEQPKCAIQEIDLIAAEENIEARIEKERQLQQQLLEDDNLAYHLVALDPHRWEIIRYHLWKDEKTAVKASADCVQYYDVLHVSEPK